MLCFVVDGWLARYYTQAEKELDLKVWELNKVGLKNVLNWDEWLGTVSFSPSSYLHLLFEIVYRLLIRVMLNE